MSRSTCICVVPANEVSWGDLQAVFGARGQASRCHCQRYKLRPRESFAHRESDTTSGVVAYLNGEPVGWRAVEPRSAYEGLLRNDRVP